MNQPLTPEQREAALNLAIIVCVAGDGFHTKIENAKELARALLDLHAENVRLREALRSIGLLGSGDLIHDGGQFVASLCSAALSCSPGY